MPVFDMAGVVGNSTVKNILQCVLPQKQLAEDPHLRGVFTM